MTKEQIEEFKNWTKYSLEYYTGIALTLYTKEEVLNIVYNAIGQSVVMNNILKKEGIHISAKDINALQPLPDLKVIK